MSTKNSASLCLALVAVASAASIGPAVGQTLAPAPWLETDPAYAGADGPALAPTGGNDAPYADGTELSRLTNTVRPPRRNAACPPSRLT